MAASHPEAVTCRNAGPSCRLLRLRRRGLGLVAAEVGDRAAPAFGGARLADVAAVEDQPVVRSEEHTSELQSLMRISYAVFCLKKKKKHRQNTYTIQRDNFHLHMSHT